MNDYTPTLAAVDGQTGYPPGAPYDRIIATCAVPAIPPAWLDQTAPGAVILTDVHGPLGGTLARLTVDEHGTAAGRFVPHWAGFMAMRRDTDDDQSMARQPLESLQQRRYPVTTPGTPRWDWTDVLVVVHHRRV